MLLALEFPVITFPSSKFQSTFEIELLGFILKATSSGGQPLFTLFKIE